MPVGMSIIWKFTQETYFQPTCNPYFNMQRRCFAGHSLDRPDRVLLRLEPA